MDEIDEKIEILSNIPDELLSNDNCKLLGSKIFLSRFSKSVSRCLNYSRWIDEAKINIRIGLPINNTYIVGITVYVFGKEYDYDKVPKDPKVYCPHVDIAYKIVAYLELIGLRLI